jgi:hypothetical protein
VTRDELVLAARPRDRRRRHRLESRDASARPSSCCRSRAPALRGKRSSRHRSACPRCVRGRARGGRCPRIRDGRFMTSSTTSPVWYVYGIVPASLSPAAAPAGLDDADVRLQGSGDGGPAALASVLDGDRYVRVRSRRRAARRARFAGHVLTNAHDARRARTDCGSISRDHAAVPLRKRGGPWRAMMTRSTPSNSCSAIC